VDWEVENRERTGREQGESRKGCSMREILFFLLGVYLGGQVVFGIMSLRERPRR
jgi:hypothetical protein